MDKRLVGNSLGDFAGPDGPKSPFQGDTGLAHGLVLKSSLAVGSCWPRRLDGLWWGVGRAGPNVQSKPSRKRRPLVASVIGPLLCKCALDISQSQR